MVNGHTTEERERRGELCITYTHTHTQYSTTQHTSLRVSVSLYLCIAVCPIHPISFHPFSSLSPSIPIFSALFHPSPFITPLCFLPPSHLESQSQSPTPIPTHQLLPRHCPPSKQLLILDSNFPRVPTLVLRTFIPNRQDECNRREPRRST